jgi:hypothetical protein
MLKNDERKRVFPVYGAWHGYFYCGNRAMVILWIVLCPLLFGYIVGRNHVNPNTKEGMKHYD